MIGSAVGNYRVVRQLGVVAFTPSASADPAPGNKELAATHHKLGASLFDQGKYDEAFVEFEQAYQLAPRPLVIYHMARARQRGGRLDEALKLYKRYLTEEPGGKGAGDAKTQIDLISRQLEDAKQRATPPATSTSSVPNDTNATAPTTSSASSETLQSNPPTSTPAPAPINKPTVTPIASSPSAPTGATATGSATSLQPDRVAAAIAAQDDSPSQLTGLASSPTETSEPRRRWPWVGVAAAAVITGVLLDTLPASARDGKLGALDFAPVGCDAAGATAAAYGLGWL